MAPATVAHIIERIGQRYTIAPTAEITLEANPGSVEAGRFRGYRTAGVNRVSLGVQSLREADLKALGRIHTVQEAKAAVGIAAATFDRFTFDLIYARPHQTLESWRDELSQALQMAGSHISLYQLAIEPETPYAALHAAGKLVVPDPDAALAFYETTQEMTAKRGLPLYEISNHSSPGQESRHNLIYWRYGTYAGIGPGAHGRIFTAGTRHTSVTEKKPEAWLEAVETHGHGLTELIPLTPAEEADEMLLMGLRLEEGLDLAHMEKLTRLTPSPAAIDELIALGRLERLGNSRIRARPEGRFVLNALVAKLAAGMATAR